jgi:hypothetical protein
MVVIGEIYSTPLHAGLFVGRPISSQPFIVKEGETSISLSGVDVVFHRDSGPTVVLPAPKPRQCEFESSSLRFLSDKSEDAALVAEAEQVLAATSRQEINGENLPLLRRMACGGSSLKETDHGEKRGVAKEATATGVSGGRPS